jgi:glucose/arabinose dehydrogenase
VVLNEPLFEGELGRVRTVVEGPDGALYALTSNRDGRGTPTAEDDRVVRIVPPAG